MKDKEVKQEIIPQGLGRHLGEKMQKETLKGFQH